MSVRVQRPTLGLPRADRRTARRPLARVAAAGLGAGFVFVVGTVLTTAHAYALPPGCGVGGSQTFSYTGDLQTFTVPIGVTEVDVALAGANGGDARYAPGGRGGAETVSGLPVTSGTTWTVLVGGVGDSGTPIGGGGTGGGGGGGSFLYTTPDLSGVLVAAGGGGGAQDPVRGADASLSANGTAGGGDASAHGGQGGADGGGGAAVGQDGGGGGAGISSNGADSTAFAGDVPAGGGLTPAAGGAGGAGGSLLGTPGGAGGFGGGGGAGGGGGGYSGGGGSSSDGGTSGGGGGGGSYAVATPSTSAFNDGHASGNGYVTITWSAPVRLTFNAEGGSGSTPSSETIACGTTTTQPGEPTRAGYTFGGWFTAASGGSGYDFSSPVTSSFTLYAQWTAWTARASVTPGTVTQGGTFTVHGSGFTPGEQVRAVLHSTPLALGTWTADSAGRVTHTATVPAGFAIGAHTVVLTGVTDGRTAQAALTVTAAPASSASTGGSPLASTGTDTAGLLSLALMVLLFGAVLTVAATHRRHG